MKIGKKSDYKDEYYKSIRMTALKKRITDRGFMSFEEVLECVCSIPLIKQTLTRLERFTDLFVDTSSISPAVAIRKDEKFLTSDICDYLEATIYSDDKERVDEAIRRFKNLTSDYQSCFDKTNASKRLFLPDGVIREYHRKRDNFKNDFRLLRSHLHGKSANIFRMINAYFSRIDNMFNSVVNDGRNIAYDHTVDNGKLYVLLDCMTKRRDFNLSPVDKEIVLSAAQHSLTSYERPTVVLSRDFDLLRSVRTLSEIIVNDKSVEKYYGKRPVGYESRLSGLFIPAFGGILWYGVNHLPKVNGPNVKNEPSGSIDVLFSDNSSDAIKQADSS